jgi:hypothetical protein
MEIAHMPILPEDDDGAALILTSLLGVVFIMGCIVFSVWS